VGKILGGWLQRPDSTLGGSVPVRGLKEMIFFSKCTCKPGRRSDLSKILMGNFPVIEKEEPGTLTILLIESEGNEDVVYAIERFRDDEAIQAHGRGSGMPRIMPVFEDVVILRDGGVCKEVII
jgi:quinol monooxygenase YgiN